MSDKRGSWINMDKNLNTILIVVVLLFTIGSKFYETGYTLRRIEDIEKHHAETRLMAKKNENDINGIKLDYGSMKRDLAYIVTVLPAIADGLKVVIPPLPE